MNIRFQQNAKLYVAVLLAAAFPAALFGFFWPIVAITRCNGTGFNADTYLAYCEDDRYGDYEEGAFFFNLEPKAVRNAQAAQILLIGNSRAQVAFSTQATRAFAQQHGWLLYRMGFGFGEGWELPDSIIRRYRLRPKVVIINADPFFTTDTSDVARDLLAPGDKSDTHLHYMIKRLAQTLDRYSCGAHFLSKLTCGSEKTIYQSAVDGSWDITRYRDAVALPVVVDEGRLLGDLPAMIVNAQHFFASTGLDPKCTILTSLPSDFSTPLVAKALAERLGTPFLLGQISDLQTFDRSHLDAQSAERWSDAFLADAEPILSRCLAASAEDKMR